MTSYLSPLENLYKWEKKKPEAIYLREPIQGVYKELSWKEVGREIRQMAAYLKGLDLPPASRIAIISKNCSHWLIADLAILMAGHISVPLYPNLTSATVKQILEHSGSSLVFIGKLDNYEEMEAGVPEGIPTISFPYYHREQHSGWNDVIEGVEPISEDVIPDPEGIATIMYTSGTTGMPKGVMHTHFNYAYVVYHAVNALEIEEGERFFSYLPLCHIAEKLLVQIGSLQVGGVISFAESLETFAQNMRDAKMTVFLAVPRIWTKFEQSILAKLPSKKLNRLLSIPVISGLIKNKIKKTLGLTHAKHIFSGAAAASPSMLSFFKKLDINIQEAYAMTENCCYSHVTLRDKIKIGSVGQPLPHCDVRISEEGEVQVKHVALMKGYYKEPQLTSETFTEDGYLKTGDEGVVDSEGYLHITGRIKDLFKSSKGKYIAPSPIELMIMESDDIEQVCVVGSGLPHPIALSVLSETARNSGQDEINRRLQNMLDSVNSRLDHHETISKIVLLKENWSIENGLLTPTLKVKRKEVEKSYSSRYEEWDGSPDKILHVN